MKIFRAAARSLLIVVLYLLTPAASSRAQEYRVTETEHESLALQYGDQVVWQFNYGSDQPQLFFDPVAVPGGPTLSWDRPPDHVWHHGLWFSWKYINGVNYWEPAPGTNRPLGRTTWNESTITTRPDHSARIQLALEYQASEPQPVMREQRTIEISAPDNENRYHFDWIMTFTAGNQDVELNRTPLPDEPGGQDWGGYAGLSIRLAKELVDRSAESTSGPVKFNVAERFRGKALALDYRGRVGDQSVGITVCDHPANLNHPSPWYVIRSGAMSYFSPAVICYGPHTLKAGESFTLRYRVIVHADHWNAKRLQQEYQAFVQQYPPE